MSTLKVYTLDEISEILQLTKVTIYRKVRSGDLKAVKIGREYRVTEEQLREFLDRHATKK